MSNSFSNPSMGKFDPSRMGLGQMGQGPSGVTSLMGLDLTPNMGPQRSLGMMSSGPTSQNLSSNFGLGSRDPAPSQSAREPDAASKLLASFGLSSSDLDALSRFPEDKITAENLPEIIQHLKRKRAEQAELSKRDSVRPSGGNWDDRSLRTSFDDRSSGLNPMGNFGQGVGSQDQAHRERLAMEERERLRGGAFFSEPSFRTSEIDFNRMGYNSLQERPMFDKQRGMPPSRNIDDFHGLPPKAYPHLCSLCDFPVNSFQNWDEHVSGRLHKKQCLLLLELFPQWKGQGMGSNPFMLQRSTNPAPGLMGPPPPQMGMGGPGPQRGNFGGRPGMEGMQGQRKMQQKQAGGRVVHVVDLQQARTFKQHLVKLVEPFGTVTNCLILNNTKEAFLEMATPEQARAVVTYYDMNRAYVGGKPVRVLLSLKYKEIKKKDDSNVRNQQKAQPKQGPKPQFADSNKNPVEGIGRVLRLCNLPKCDYSDISVVNLANKYGKVVNYILMRKMRQAFVEMERAEDAQAMIDQCAKNTLLFKGVPIQVVISQKYSCLVLKIPNPQQQGRKRTRSSGDAGKNKKQRNDRADADMVTTEEDVVTGDCDPELDDDDDSVDLSHLDASGSGDDNDAEVPDISDLNQSEQLSSTPLPAGNESAPSLLENTEDEVGSETSKLNSVNQENKQPSDEMDVDKPTESQSASNSGAATKSNAIALTLEDLGPYQPCAPTGINYIIPKTGYYCKLCCLFYTSEDMAKTTHCSSLSHYKKVKKILTQQSQDKSNQEKTEQ